MNGPRVGIVGAGTIGRTHLNAYRAAGATLVAVTDTDPAAAAAVAEEYGIRGYTDTARMIQEADLDAVSICTPPVGHHEAVLMALAAGLPVLCEKPMARTNDECLSMIAAADDSGAFLTVGFCHRFQPEIEAMRELVAEGRIGRVLSFRNRFSGPLDGVESSWFAQPRTSGGGVLMDTSVHSVDLFRYLIGEIEQVVAVAATTATDRGPALEVEDSAVLTVRSTDGVLGVIEASWRTSPGEAVISISGTQGRLELDYAAGTLSLRTPDGGQSMVEVPHGDRFVRQAAHFLDCVAGRAQPRVTAHDGARAVALLSDAYTSAGPLFVTEQEN